MTGAGQLFTAPAHVLNPADLGRGARLLVPKGLSFGALQAKRGGRFHDWFRDEPDRHHVAGSRHALHLGVDLAFFVRGGQVHMLPEELPVRAPADGVVARTFEGGTSELEPGGLIILHGTEDGDVRTFTYLGDVREAKRPREVVRAGEVVARTLLQRHKGSRRVVVHLGIGLWIPDHGMEFIDPCVLLKRWGVRHPVFPGSTCTPARLRRARPGVWRGPGAIEGSIPGGKWDRSWRTRY